MCTSLKFSKIEAPKQSIYIAAVMHNFIANFVRIRQICKYFARNHAKTANNLLILIKLPGF